MVSTMEDDWRYRSLRNLLRVLPTTAHALRALPLPKARKWSLGGLVADNLRTPMPATNVHRVAQMAEGFKMNLDLSESYERRMYYSRLYAPVLASLFKHLLSPGDTVVDGGANIGFFSLLAAKCVGEYGSIHSFEPIMQTFETLKENICLNSFTNIYTHRLALTRSAGELCFEIPTDAYTGLPLGRLATIALLGRGPQVTVPADTLDEYADRTGITSIKLVKLDVEGSEVAAIAGMRQMLSEHRISYLICELSTILLDEMGMPYSSMQDALSEYGYSCYLIKSRGAWFGKEPVELVANSLPIYGDYLFTAPGMTIPRNMTT